MARDDEQVFVANDSFVMNVDGKEQMFHKGRTRVAKGSKYYKQAPELFVAVDSQTVHFGVDTATSAPAELRGEPRGSDKK